MASCKNWEAHDWPPKRQATLAKFDDIFGVLSNVSLVFLFIKHFHYEIIEFCKCNVVLILQIMAPVRVKMEDKVLYHQICFQDTKKAMLLKDHLEAKTAQFACDTSHY